MLQKGMQKKKKPTSKSSKEILAARNKSVNDKEEVNSGRPTKYPRTADTKRMNIFVPGELHKKLRQASVDHDLSMNEIIINVLFANLDNYKGE